MSCENQFHSNQGEMWLKVAHLAAGAAQQSLLLGIHGTFPESQIAAPRQCLGGKQQTWDFQEPAGLSLGTLMLSNA